jgi:hypothetical protein
LDILLAEGRRKKEEGRRKKEEGRGNDFYSISNQQSAISH